MMRSRKNMLKAGIIALVHHFSTNGLGPDASMAKVDQLFIDAFEWTPDQVVEKLPNYRARYNRLEYVYSIVGQSRAEIAEALDVDSDLVNDCIDKLKDHGYLTQYGRGNGKVLILAGAKMDFPELDDMKLTLHEDGVALRNREGLAGGIAPAKQGLFDINLEELENAEPEEFMLAISEQFKVLAEKFKGMQHASKAEVEEKDRLIQELEDHNENLADELDLVKRTSWR